jgi:hypothetical protein
LWKAIKIELNCGIGFKRDGCHLDAVSVLAAAQHFVPKLTCNACSKVGAAFNVADFASEFIVYHRGRKIEHKQHIGNRVTTVGGL